MKTAILDSILFYKSQWFTEWKKIDKNEMIFTHVKISLLKNDLLSLNYAQIC